MNNRTIKKNPPPFLVRQHLANLNQYSGHNLIEVKRDPEIVSSLVNNLVHVFNIQDGNHLTFVLGFGECSDNKEALQKWIKSQLPLQGNLNDVFKELKSLLLNKLSPEEIL
ncbi:hypothetical protein [Thiomicrorhabdus sp. Milos-T2]|uniref:hypothetical protein n=1 Tax=Thiomicrorhabdus sp. Milos-T2 TaxID=90814 RepID=UPI0004942D5C|nr:hypothetical protein [Thiomicrorhabdus sp. Milos-T2]